MLFQFKSVATACCSNPSGKSEPSLLKAGTRTYPPEEGSASPVEDGAPCRALLCEALQNQTLHGSHPTAETVALKLRARASQVHTQYGLSFPTAETVVLKLPFLNEPFVE